MYYYSYTHIYPTLKDRISNTTHPYKGVESILPTKPPYNTETWAVYSETGSCGTFNSETIIYTIETGIYTADSSETVICTETCVCTPPKPASIPNHTSVPGQG